VENAKGTKGLVKATNRSIFTKDLKIVLVEFILEMADLGFPYTPRHIYDVATSIFNNVNPLKKQMVCCLIPALRLNWCIKLMRRVSSCLVASVQLSSAKDRDIRGQLCLTAESW